jgi:hypothetical protein
MQSGICRSAGGDRPVRSIGILVRPFVLFASKKFLHRSDCDSHFIADFVDVGVSNNAIPVGQRQHRFKDALGMSIFEPNSPMSSRPDCPRPARLVRSPALVAIEVRACHCFRHARTIVRDAYSRSLSLTHLPASSDGHSDYPMCP